jgi:glutamate synthase domain-containing protein 2
MRSQKVLEAQKSGKLTVLLDSGIRTGSDVIKALAMGAQGVLRASSFYHFCFHSYVSSSCSTVCLWARDSRPSGSRADSNADHL